MSGTSVAAISESIGKVKLMHSDPPTLTVEELSSSSIAADGITPAVVSVIAAAAAAFVGRKVRILSVRLLDEANGDSSAWASQGRDMIQSSHNVVQRGH